MRVSILFTYSESSSKVHVFGSREQNLFFENIGETNISKVIRKALENHDLCIVFVMPYAQPLDTCLDAVRTMDLLIQALSLTVTKPVAIELRLVADYGHLLRLAHFASILHYRVNSMQDLKGSTVIANIY